MKKSGYFSGLFFYLVVLPAMLWLLLRIPGLNALLKAISGGALLTALSVVMGLLLAEIARRVLRYSGRKRQISNSLPEEQRTYSIQKQGIFILIGLILTAIAALTLNQSPLRFFLYALHRLGATLLTLFGLTSTASLSQWLGSVIVVTIGLLSLASPIWPSKPPKHKTYTLEMYNPFLSKIPLFSPERFILRYLAKLIRTDFLNRFNEHTVFAGRIHCLHEGRATVWYVTYDERIMQAAPEYRPLHSEHIERILTTLRKLEKEGTTLSHTIITDIIKEHKLAERIEQADSGADPDLGDLTSEELQRITQVLAATEYDNLLTLDLENCETDDRAEQAYKKRLNELATAANRSLVRNIGTYELNIHRRDRKLTTKVLQFKVDPQETIRRSTEEYGDRTNPQQSLLYATLRGASGEHAEGFDAETETVGEELEGLESIAGGASALDHIQELNPSVQQMVVEAKGFGRVLDIQLGKESYQVITEWLRSAGINPVTGWRLFRCSKVIDSDGNTVARRTQDGHDLLPHLFGLIGLGKEWSHVKIIHNSLNNQDKLPLALLALDAFEANDFKNRRRILRMASSADAASK